MEDILSLLLQIFGGGKNVGKKVHESRDLDDWSGIAAAEKCKE
jgi:hypothetical protein